MIIVVYAPHDPCDKRMLWDYLAHVINQWQGEVVIMGDFNEVRVNSDRIAAALGQILSDHRPILLRGKITRPIDYGPVPFRFFHLWIISRAVMICPLQRGILPLLLTLIGKRNLAKGVEPVRYGYDKEIKTDVGVGHQTNFPRATDGFSFGFYRHFWPVIEHDVYMAVNHFFIHGEIPPGCDPLSLLLYYHRGGEPSFIFSKDRKRGEWSDGNISTFDSRLKCFFHASGLKINLDKSRYWVNVESAQVT
ncbi:RNA-directed DNA polymerase, eukaryota, reverse transcriptase zinc-binding domain protein [Tanacetum coccineum]|uniref:RNA-directed DNA polymerase, eukaryota, reverse transcriptase zinc-binding domain protein n=1 Tax=Tanacetum coccineum TaxID=301880 RepID=A0ABQ4YQX8_9ASTR